MRSGMSRKGQQDSEQGVLILKDLLREKYPETYQWLYGKSRKRSGSITKTS